MTITAESTVCHPSHVRRIWGDQPMAEIRVDVTLVNAVDESLAADGRISDDEIRYVEANGMVDSGAIGTVISQNVAKQLGLPLTRKRTVTLADGSSKTLDVVAPVRFELLGRDTDCECLVMGEEVLIGQTVLEMTDLFIDCANARVVPNPDHPDGPILYVK